MEPQAFERVIAKLEAMPALCFDLETTGLTPQDAPVRVGKTARIGGAVTARDYAERNGCTFDTSLRARVAAIGDGAGETFAADLDTLNGEQRERLFRAMLEGKTVAGHNLAFDLQWASWYTDARPARLLDTLLVARVFAPGSARAGTLIRGCGDDDFANPAADMVTANKSGKSATLGGLALTYRLPGAVELATDKAFQKPINWTPTRLSREHYDYATGDVDFPVRLARVLLGAGPDYDIDALADAAYANEHYARAAAATIRLADMHAHGVPVDVQALEEHRDTLMARIDDNASVLAQRFDGVWSGDTLEELRASKAGLSDAAKEEITASLEAAGVKPRDQQGKRSLDVKSCRAAGARGVEWWSDFETLSAAKKELGMVEDYIGRVQRLGGDRLHGLFGINCTTLRLSSQSPNMQNIPNGPLRSVFRARGGALYVAADYSQIELRIAAALAIRAFREAENADGPGWAVEAVHADRIPEPAPTHPNDMPRDASPLDRQKAYLQQYKHDLCRLYREVKSRGFKLAEVFQRNVDPHLATGIAMMQRSGEWSDQTDAIDYLAGCDPDTVKALKERYGQQRTRAKPANFGLLYGMQPALFWRMGVADYAIDWSMDEAAEARDVWFSQYPDVAFWQLWSRIAYVHGKRDMLVNIGYGRTKRDNRKLWKVRSLSGRAMVALSANEAMNYQDQGTGADMSARVLQRFESEHGALVSQVHDEFIGVAPESCAEEFAADLKAYMLESAQKDLEPYGIPVEVDTGVGEAWHH